MADSVLKLCPFCKEQIRKEAIKCRFCGEWLESKPEPKADSLNLMPDKPIPPPPQKSAMANETKAVARALDKEFDSERFAPPRKENGQNEPHAADSTKANAPADSGMPRTGYGRAIVSIIPLILIVFVVWQAGVTAMQNKAFLIAGIMPGTLSYCTTPLSLIILLALAIWFGRSLRGILAHWRTASVIGVCLIVLPLWLLLSVIGVSVALATKNQRQSTSATAFNPHALDGWEVLKKDQQLGDVASGLTPPARKRLREMLALQLKSSLAAVPEVNVSLEGADHDKLVVSFGNTNPSVAKLAEALQLAETDFWNEMRFFNFSEVVLTGAGQHEAFAASQFTQWTRGYDAFVSRMLALYKNQLFGNRGAELSPMMQRPMRRRLASTMNGGLKNIYKTIEVRSEGENDDKLVIYLPEMNGQIADGLLTSFQRDKDANFFNGLRALAFSDLVFSGGNYRRSIPQTEFTQWCRNYEKYLSELKKAVGQISSDLEHEPKTP